MKKLIFVIFCFIILGNYTNAYENGSIEHVGGDTILTYDGESITLKDKSIYYNTQNCPEGYHKATAEDWSKLIKMRWDIDGKNYKFMELNKMNNYNDYNSIKEEFLDIDYSIGDSFGLDAFRNDVLNGDNTAHYKTTTKWQNNKHYIFVYQELESFNTGPARHNKGSSRGYLSIKTCGGVQTRNGNVCNDSLKTRCFKNQEVQGQESEKSENNFSREYNDAYKFAYENKITTMPTIEEANMTGEIIRAEIAKMFSNWLKSLGYEVNTQKQCKFTDTKSVQGDLAPAIIESCQFGIMGQGITKFRPFDKITKGEVATAVSRIIRGDKYNGGEPFYINHINALKEVGVIDETSDINKNELRGNVMLMLMKANDVIKNN